MNSLSSNQTTRKRLVRYALVIILFCTLIFYSYVSQMTMVGDSVFNSNDHGPTGAKQSRKADDMFLQRSVQLFDNGLQFDASFSPLYHKQPQTPTFGHTPQKYFGSERVVPNVDCGLLFEQNDKEIEKVRKMNVSYESQSFCQRTKACENFIKARGYIMDSLSEEERNFPIAYSILVYKSPEQFEILLRSIYRPLNSYCVHVDGKTTRNVFNEFSCIVRCFPNVKMASKRIEVNWGTMSVLLPELTCMKDLLSIPKWKYFINLTGQEFPLRTNYELVKILKVYNGSNDGEGTIKRANKERWNIKEKPPHDIVPVKGSVHVTLNRRFVEYVITNRVAADFLEWVNKTGIPDETFFATLIHNPQLEIPGSFKGKLETDFGIRKPFLSRFKNWNSWPCGGKYVRSICIFGIEDLARLARRPEFFANKFHSNYQGHTLLCMDQLIYNRTRDEYLHRLKFDTKYYESLKHIKNVV
nr:beta-1,3-galactosyl-O-glycosyl-glycoprotein beta-1,6-N-acetylglucosaminyltransferase [Crassostrea gigas]